MNTQSGRSLIEVIGVLAITGFMTAAALGAYRIIQTNQTRSIADAQLQQIAQDIKILMEMRGSYQGISIDYLIKAGALQSDKQPIGGPEWSITPSFDGKDFMINLVNLTNGECKYFSSSKPSWTTTVIVNGFETGYTDNCFDSDTNQISFVAH